MTPISEADKQKQVALHTQDQFPERLSSAQLVRTRRYILTYLFGTTVEYIKIDMWMSVSRRQTSLAKQNGRDKTGKSYESVLLAEQHSMQSTRVGIHRPLLQFSTLKTETTFISG